MGTSPREANTRHPGAEVFGYPGHRTVKREDTVHPNGIQVSRLTAACGFTQKRTGHWPKSVLRFRTCELCEAGCWS